MKGISFIELHVEKIVLAAVVLVAVGLLVWQFLGGGASAEIDGRPVPPGEIDDVLAEKASELNALQSDAAQARPSLAEPPTFAAAIREEATAPLTDTPTLALAQYRPMLDLAGYEATAIKAFVVPTFPAPEDLFVSSFATRIAEAELAELPELRERLFGAEGEVEDRSFNTVAAVIDLEAYRNAYATRPEGDDTLPIPGTWYGNRLFILDLVLEREELVDGNWTNLTVVDPLPGFLTFRPDIEATDLPVAVGEEILQTLADPAAQAEIIRPGFYETVGTPWSPPQRPTEENLGPAIQHVRDLESRLQVARRRLERSEEQLQGMGGEFYPPEEDRDRDDDRGPGGGGGGDGPSIPGGGGGGGGLGLGGGGGGGDAGGDEPGGRDDGQASEAARARKTRERDRLREFVARIEEQLAAAREAAGLDDQPAGAVGLPDLTADDSVLVWGHDPFVETGRTYRYRMVAKVYNPFFGRASRLVDDQKDLAAGVALASNASDWSEPTTVDAHTRYFVVEANENRGNLGEGTAKVEVYRLKDGTWQKQTFEVQPGDPVGGLIAGDGGEIDYRTGATLLDVVARPGEDGRDERFEILFVLADGTVVRRDLAADRASLDRRRLDETIREIARGG